jgi:hypothetical protein
MIVDVEMMITFHQHKNLLWRNVMRNDIDFNRLAILASSDDDLMQPNSTVLIPIAADGAAAAITALMIAGKKK